MITVLRTFALGSAVALLAASPASARHARYRGIRVHRQLAYGSGPDAPLPAPLDPYVNAPGYIIEAATNRARREPGVTTELDPTAKETATGGPSGGIPLSGGGP